MKRAVICILLGVLALVALVAWLNLRGEDKIHDAPPPPAPIAQLVARGASAAAGKITDMTLRPVVLPPQIPGKLWLSSMPGRFDPWPAFESEARGAGLALVVCLTPRHELAQLSPAYHAALAQGLLPFRWLNLPMPNFGLPDDPPGFRREIGRIVDAIRNGDSVLLHCAAGLGRTGTAAACVLKALGVDQGEALEQVRAAGSNPQNARQSGLVDWF